MLPAKCQSLSGSIQLGNFDECLNLLDLKFKAHEVDH